MKSSLSALSFALALGGALLPAHAQTSYPVVFGGASYSTHATPGGYYAGSAAPPASQSASPTYLNATQVASSRLAPEEVASPPPQAAPAPAYGYDGQGANPHNPPFSGWSNYAGSGANTYATGSSGCDCDPSLWGTFGAHGSSYGATCGDGSCGCGDCGCPRWTAYVGGVVMGRNTPNNFWTTYETDNNPNQLMYFPNADWGGGVEARLGYWFGCPTGGGCGSINPYCNCCYQNGIEVIYWGVYGLDGQSSLYSPTDQLSTPINLGLVSIGGDPAADYFDNARSHRLTRNDEIHNIELNLLHIPCCTGNDNLRLTWLAGVRYFRFTDAIEFGTLAGTAPANAQFGQYPVDEAFLDVDVENNLVGFQLGARADYCIHNRWTIFAAPKAGIFGNHVSARNSLYQGNGNVAIFDETGNEFDLNDSVNKFAFLASIDVGFTYAFTPNCLLNAGYRVVAVSGVALADDQIPAYLAAEDEWREIETNGDLILHGAFAGLELRF